MNIHVSHLVHKYVPAKDAQTKGVLVLAHGRTGNVKLLEWFTKRFQIPSLGYLLIQAPFKEQRPDQTDEGFSWYLDKRGRIDESRKLLIEMVQELMGSGLAATQIYWLGFSQGACIGLDLALRGPFKLGGILGISGLVVQANSYPDDFGPHAREQRIFLTHGTRDTIITLEEAEKTYDVLRRHSIPFDLKIFDKPHSFHLNEEVPYLESLLKAWISE